MSTAGLAKVTAKTAAEICKQFELGDEAQALLRDNLTPKQFLDVLMEKGAHIDAIRYFTFALPKREAIWWACQCARLGYGANIPPKAAAALQAAEKWVSDQKDESRWAAKKTGEAAGNEQPAGLAALATFFSGGNIAPPGSDHKVPAPEHLTGLIGGAAVMLAGVYSEAEKSAEKYKKFLALGIDVANSTNKWKE